MDVFVGTARIACGGRSTQLSGVRPSVRPSVRLSVCPIRQPHAAAVCPAARRFRSIAARPAVSTSALQYGAKQQMRGVPRRKLNTDLFRTVSEKLRRSSTDLR